MRHRGKVKFKNLLSIKESEMYDWIVDINLLSSVAIEGWKLYFREDFLIKNKHFLASFSKGNETPNIDQVAIQNNESENSYMMEDSAKKKSVSDIEKVSTKKDKDLSWEGAIVAVVGLYDKGKTFVLNNLTTTNLPSGKKVNTKGLSFKQVDVDYGTKLVLLDSAGSYSPVKVMTEFSVIEKEATELFILDLVFELSDYFIFVVNDFTSLDQRYLDKLSRNLQNSSTKPFKEIIVVHNLKDVENQEILDHLWESQVTQIYGSGNVQRTKVAAINTINGNLQEKHVVWFKTAYSRHVCLANDDSILGNNLNPWTFSLLRYWLKAVFVPVNREFSVVESVFNVSALKLSTYFKSNDTNENCVKVMKTHSILSEMRLPQVSIDSSGFITTRPDGFIPLVDIVKDKEYVVFMEVPGLKKEDIVISRQNVLTIVRGNKKKPIQLKKTDEVVKSERKYGEFTMTFKIPETYERRWSSFEVQNGILIVKYPRDNDDAQETNGLPKIEEQVDVEELE